MRLTVGASPPAFPSTTSTDEWNTEALGRTNRKLAHELWWLRGKYSKDGVLHHGQGSSIPAKACRAGPTAACGGRRRTPLGRCRPHRGRTRPQRLDGFRHPGFLATLSASWSGFLPCPGWLRGCLLLAGRNGARR
ncbi:MAG: transglutaminase family protein [Fibrobacteres bacterium]|nr:transglutaminase family protein [Fibrobacterota bacterium]